MVEICWYSHLYLAFFFFFFWVLSEHLFIGEPAWKYVTPPSSVYACVHKRMFACARVWAMKYGNTFHKKIK